MATTAVGNAVRRDSKIVWVKDYKPMNEKEQEVFDTKMKEAATVETPYFTPFVAEYAVYSVSEARFVEILDISGVDEIIKQNDWPTQFKNKGYIIPLRIAAEMHQYQLQMKTDGRQSHIQKQKQIANQKKDAAKAGE